MRALVTGATGFVGRRLVKALDRPVVLSRDAARARRELGDVEAHSWDPMAGPPPAEALRGVDAVFHLAGEPVPGRWTEARKARIRESRVTGTRNLVAGIEAAKERPKVLVSASAIGYYGSRDDEELAEDATAGSDFIGELCRGWEAAALRAEALGVRVATPRIGIVLGAGGALARMLPPFKLGLGGRIGSGRQWWSWVHLDDLVGLLLHAAATDGLRGALNAVAPHPVTNAEFTRVLARILRRPAFFPVPGFALRLAAGDFASALLSSQRVLPRAAEASGYRFRFPELEGALRAILGG